MLETKYGHEPVPNYSIIPNYYIKVNTTLLDWYQKLVKQNYLLHKLDVTPCLDSFIVNESSVC